MAVSLSELGRHEEALSKCKKALSRDPENHWLRDLKATIEFNMGNLNRTMGEIIEDEDTIIIIDTNVWLDYFGFRPKKSSKYAKAYVKKAIKRGKARIIEIVACEFYTNIGREIARLVYQGKQPEKSSKIKMHEKSIDGFGELFMQIGIRQSSLEKKYFLALKNAEKMFSEIWKDDSYNINEARINWFTKNSGITREVWDGLKSEDKTKLLENNRPTKNNDFGILVTAATLASIYGDKRITLLTNDRDFRAFAGYIMRMLRVEVKRPPIPPRHK